MNGERAEQGRGKGVVGGIRGVLDLERLSEEFGDGLDIALGHSDGAGVMMGSCLGTACVATSGCGSYGAMFCARSWREEVAVMLGWEPPG